MCVYVCVCCMDVPRDVCVVCMAGGCVFIDGGGGGGGVAATLYRCCDPLEN